MTWVGQASLSIINSPDQLEINVPYVLNKDFSSLGITWNNNQKPPGTFSDTLGTTFVEGYKVYYTVFYELLATIYWDTGDTYFRVTTVSYPDKKTVVPDVILRPNVKTGAFTYQWAYGTDGSPSIPFYEVPNPVIPTRITYMFGKTGVGYRPYNVTWNIHFFVNVVRNCDRNNITAPICMIMCQADPKLCSVDYDEYCLREDPNRLASDVCKGYYSEYIGIYASTPDIDAQARKYCAKYDGFADLFTPSPKRNEEERLKDITICACHLSAKDVPDPDATVLYDRYFNNLVAKFPAFGVYGASIQKRCLLPQCASSNFRPVGVPPSGCTVPQCVNLISIDNNGTINGDIKTTATCQSQFAGNGDAPTDSSFTIIVIIIVVILLIFILVLYFYGRKTGTQNMDSYTTKYNNVT
jgi:hypothetical protein